MASRVHPSSAVAPALLVLALCSLLCLPARASQCYLEGSACALCWRTDSAGNRNYGECPDYVSLTFTEPPPAEMFEGDEYSVAFAVSVRSSELAIVPIRQRTGGEAGSPVEVSHANVHACFSTAGSCTPFIKDTPGLSTHTLEQRGNLTSPEDTAVFRSTLRNLAEGKYTVISHARFAVLDESVEDPLRGCDGEACLTTWDVAYGVWATVFPAGESPVNRCYLKAQPAITEDCDLCWRTDSRGLRTLEICPSSIRVQFTTAPPVVMLNEETYRVGYSLELDTDVSSRIVSKDGVQIIHANLHSCRTEAGKCTPFVAESPKLSTHTTAIESNLHHNSSLLLAQDISLPPGKYTIIIHFRFLMLDHSVPDPSGGCDGKDCLATYDIASGMRAIVFPIGQVLGDEECLEDADCTTCWVNAGRGSEITRCNPGITTYFNSLPPKQLFADERYPIQYAISVDPRRVALFPHPEMLDHYAEGDFAQSFLAVCLAGHGDRCVPMKASQDGWLAGLRNSNGVVVSREAGQMTFQSDLVLPPGEYVVVAHFQVFLKKAGSPADCNPVDCGLELNLAITLPREVVQPSSGISGGGSDQAVVTISVIVAVLVAVVLVVLGLFIWGMRSGYCLPDKFIENRMTIDDTGSLSVLAGVGSALTVNTIKKISKQTRLVDKPNLFFHRLSQQVINLHEGLDEELRHIPMRLLSASYVKSAQALVCYEEMSALKEHIIDIPYSATTQDMWDKTAVVSWRWSKAKPAEMVPGFTPLTDEQLTQLQMYLESNKKIEYVWLDWSCVAQYTGNPMVEVARSKLFYSRARMMFILPTFRPLASSGETRVILSTAIRTLAAKWKDRSNTKQDLTACEPDASEASFKPQLSRTDTTKSLQRDQSVKYLEKENFENTLLAVTVLKEIRNKHRYSEYTYFGRAWTLAERMARHGREESLRNWLDLEIWMGMALDALWQASDPSVAEMEPVLGYYWGKIFERSKSMSVIESLRTVRQRGSSLASNTLNDQIADLFIEAVQVWKSAFATEALDIPWLQNYLVHDAGHLYHSFMPEDLVYSIYTFFCWHLRTEFITAHRDLCLLADVSAEDSALLRTVNQVSSGCSPQQPPTVAVTISSGEKPKQDSTPFPRQDSMLDSAMGESIVLNVNSSEDNRLEEE